MPSVEIPLITNCPRCGRGDLRLISLGGEPLDPPPLIWEDGVDLPEGYAEGYVKDGDGVVECDNCGEETSLVEILGD